MTPDTPPTFLWHTATDETVPVENSLYASPSLSAAGGFPQNYMLTRWEAHGLSLANEETCRANGIGVQKECQSWIGLAQDLVEKKYS